MLISLTSIPEVASRKWKILQRVGTNTVVKKRHNYYKSNIENSLPTVQQNKRLTKSDKYQKEHNSRNNNKIPSSAEQRNR